jgi:hypothetical protein
MILKNFLGCALSHIGPRCCSALIDATEPGTS